MEEKKRCRLGRTHLALVLFWISNHLLSASVGLQVHTIFKHFPFLKFVFEAHYTIALEARPDGDLVPGWM